MPEPINSFPSASSSCFVHMQQPIPPPRSMKMGLPVLPPVGVPIILPLRAPLNDTQKFSAEENVVEFTSNTTGFR